MKDRGNEPNDDGNFIVMLGYAIPASVLLWAVIIGAIYKFIL